MVARAAAAAAAAVDEDGAAVGGVGQARVAVPENEKAVLEERWGALEEEEECEADGVVVEEGEEVQQAEIGGGQDDDFEVERLEEGKEEGEEALGEEEDVDVDDLGDQVTEEGSDSDWRQMSPGFSPVRVPAA